MINSDFKDADGFRLQFEESVSDEERKYYMKTFPRVDEVSKDRIHCTTCDCHVGTAPISEKIIRTHQILSVTQCNKCFAFYNSGEFGKGEDGSEYYCRWCGQGGEVFCCSSCPFVFCNKCIKDNLTDKYVKEIEENDDWSCFVCNKEILKRMRAQHWALRNFMNKQLEKIQKVNITSEDELNNLLNDDLTSCCPKKKRKIPLPKPTPAPIKRPLPNGGQITMIQPPAKRPTIIAPMNKQIKIPVHPSFHSPKPGPRLVGPRRQSEVVCTPDIMGIFNEQGSNSSAPPPLAMRQIQRPIAPRGPAVPNPIYHTVNGFQIDLNQASRQEIFRLPNGKLIQVRKQTNPTAAPPRLSVPTINSASGLTGVLPRGTQFSIRPSSAVPNMTTQSRMMRPQAQAMPRVRAPSSQRFSFSDGRVVSGASQGNSTAASNATTNASTIFTQQNGSISVARAPQADTPFGKSKTAFEDRIIQGLEICQHTINKMITLTNSTSFKTSRSFNDIKELYIHLQYLFTYTSGKFKTLQDGLITGMEDLAKQDASLKEKNPEDDDDLEMVQQKVDIIEVMSDDDEPCSAAEKKPDNPDPPATINSNAPEKTDEIEERMEVEPDFPLSFLETILETTSTVTESVMSPEELLASLNVETDDEKLKKRTAVKVERLEDSKNAIIKEYLVAIQQRRDAENDEIEESDNDLPVQEEIADVPFVPEVVIGESQNETTEREESETTLAIAVDEPNQTESSATSDVPIEDEIKSDDELVQKSTNENISDIINDVSKIAETLPADLMETSNADDNALDVSNVDDSSVIEVTLNGSVEQNEIIKIPQECIQDNIQSTPEDEVLNEGVTNESPHENGENMGNLENIHQEPIKTVKDTTIEDETDLLDTLINSLDEPLASIDMEIPETLG